MLKQITKNKDRIMVMSASKRKMTKRISVSMPDLAHEKLQRWADIEGTSLSDLAAYLLRREIEIAEKEGRLISQNQLDRQELSRAS
jgi:tartrate dehydratase alpha subunit/fumarate hydratase class I-like protein